MLTTFTANATSHTTDIHVVGDYNITVAGTPSQTVAAVVDVPGLGTPNNFNLTPAGYTEWLSKQNEIARGDRVIIYG